MIGVRESHLDTFIAASPQQVIAECRAQGQVHGQVRLPAIVSHGGGAARLMEAQPERAVSIVALMELVQGVRSRAEIRAIHGFLREGDIRLIPVNESISHLALSLIEAHALVTGCEWPTR